MIISNTQVSLENLCERAHYYRFILGIEPKSLPPAIYTGILGHKALEWYYLEMRDGSPVDQCLKAAKVILNKEAERVAIEEPESYDLMSAIFKINKLIEGYARIYSEEEFKILEIEQEYQTPINEHDTYAMKLDLLVEMTKGPYRGNLILVDHKFVYNFKTVLDIDMDAQLPKYIRTLRQNGYVVNTGMFNQIRTRSLKDPGPADLYRREVVSFKSRKSEIDSIWREQEITAHRISLKMESKNPQCVRNMNQLVCRSCMFQKPCKAELNGDDITQMVNANYQKSTYGYTELIDNG